MVWLVRWCDRSVWLACPAPPPALTLTLSRRAGEGMITVDEGVAAVMDGRGGLVGGGPPLSPVPPHPSPLPRKGEGIVGSDCA